MPDTKWPRTGPSHLVRLVLRPMAKVLNPLVCRFAGRRHFRMASQVHHVGRRSGRAYVTSAGARVVGDSVWIPLTFGTESDWCRNIEAAGGGTIVYRGHTYIAADPEVHTRREALTKARAGFRLPERLSMPMLGIQHFLRMDAQLDGRPLPGRSATGRLNARHQ